MDEYYEHHQHVPIKVQEALRSVGIRNLSLWYWESRMFYYAEYVSDEPFEQAYVTFCIFNVFLYAVFSSTRFINTNRNLTTLFDSILQHGTLCFDGRS